MHFYDIVVKDVKKKEVSLRKYQGNVLLIVNTAIRCGYANQYDGLEKLYDEFKYAGFEILDFPCNQFFNQAPGESTEIANQCQLTYGVQFQIFNKIKVNGKKASPLYVYLKKNGPVEKHPSEISTMRSKIARFFGMNRSKRIRWNFTKFLVDRNGNIVYRFSPGYTPESIKPYLIEVLEK